MVSLAMPLEQVQLLNYGRGEAGGKKKNFKTKKKNGENG